MVERIKVRFLTLVRYSLFSISQILFIIGLLVNSLISELVDELVFYHN
jgi:hypothetical protein